MADEVSMIKFISQEFSNSATISKLVQLLSATPQSTHTFSTFGSKKELRREPSKNVHVLHASPVFVLNELLNLILFTQPSATTSLMSSGVKP